MADHGILLQVFQNYSKMTNRSRVSHLSQDIGKLVLEQNRVVREGLKEKKPEEGDLEPDRPSAQDIADIAVSSLGFEG